LAFSRHDQTPRQLLIELQADGKDYGELQSGVEAALGESWQAVVDVLTAAHSKLTRQEIRARWPEDYAKPDRPTLWRWLSRGVAQAVVRQQGTGRLNDPFRYWLPERQDMMRPDGASREEMQAWNDRWVAELFGGPEQASDRAPAPEAVPSGTVERKAAAPVAGPEGTPPTHEPAPPPGSGLGTAASAAPTPDPASSPAAEALAPATVEAPVRLPYPFNLMNPAKVPETVWLRVRADQRKT
jgi:hypothetical protein